jgi:XXXCH domain-containing protein
MKPSERKIKQVLPLEALPAYLRQLADALDRRTDGLPAELQDLPDPMTKLEIKGKVRDGAWELKAKIKAEAAPAPEQAAGVVAETAEAPAAEKPQVKYKDLKKRMKSSFKDIAASLEAQRLPEPEILEAFLADSDRMTAFAGAKYGEPYYPAYREACRRLAAAYEAKSWEAFRSAYADLDQLKKDCHKAYK